jgi:hypothetical protein
MKGDSAGGGELSSITRPFASNIREDTEGRLLIARETEHSAECEHSHISSNVSEGKTTFRDETKLKQDRHHVFNL